MQAALNSTQKRGPQVSRLFFASALGCAKIVVFFRIVAERIVVEVRSRVGLPQQTLSMT
jgi:hypothetical protein|tara:strand:- start:23184 stop:23360 length:177 start_codon:yes stop_codon:yes gene_type:complete